MLILLIYFETETRNFLNLKNRSWCISGAKRREISLVPDICCVTQGSSPNEMDAEIAWYAELRVPLERQQRYFSFNGLPRESIKFHYKPRRSVFLPVIVTFLFRLDFSPNMDFRSIRKAPLIKDGRVTVSNYGKPFFNKRRQCCWTAVGRFPSGRSVLGKRKHVLVLGALTTEWCSICIVI